MFLLTAFIDFLPKSRTIDENPELLSPNRGVLCTHGSPVCPCLETYPIIDIEEESLASCALCVSAHQATDRSLMLLAAFVETCEGLCALSLSAPASGPGGISAS